VPNSFGEFQEHPARFTVNLDVAQQFRIGARGLQLFNDRFESVRSFPSLRQFFRLGLDCRRSRGASGASGARLLRLLCDCRSQNSPSMIAAKLFITVLYYACQGAAYTLSMAESLR